METKKLLQNFCRNIRALRIEHGLSQKEMARLLDISLYSLRRIEDGSIPKNATVDILYNAHSAFGVTPNQLFCELPEWQ